MRKLYAFLELPYYEHDFENIQSLAKDLDIANNNKFRHGTRLKVTPTDEDEWQRYIPAHIAKYVSELYPRYNELFGY